jgi:hypothetical protein
MYLKIYESLDKYCKILDTLIDNHNGSDWRLMDGIGGTIDY